MGLIIDALATQENDSTKCCIKRINVLPSESKPGLGDTVKTNKWPSSAPWRGLSRRHATVGRQQLGPIHQPGRKGAFICRGRRGDFEVLHSEVKEQPWPQPLCLCSRTSTGRALNEWCGYMNTTAKSTRSHVCVRAKTHSKDWHIFYV